MWEFAAGCMRTYLALAERARHFDSLPEVRRRWRRRAQPSSASRRSTAGAADALKAEADGLDALAARGYANERLDQLLVDVLLGVR